MRRIYAFLRTRIGLLLGLLVCPVLYFSVGPTPTIRPVTSWTQPGPTLRGRALLLFSPDGRFVVTDGSSGGAIRNPLDGQLLVPLSPDMQSVAFSHQTGLHRVAFSTDGRRLIAQIGGSRYHHTPAGLKVWEVETGKTLFSSEDIGSGLDFVRFASTPDLSVVAVPSDRNAPKFHSTPPPDVKGKQMPEVVTSTGLIGNFDVHNLDQGTVVRRLGGLPPIAISPDGTKLVTCDTNVRSGRILVWDVQSREVVATLGIDPSSQPTEINFTAAGRSIVALGHTWNASTGEQLAIRSEDTTQIRPDQSRTPVASARFRVIFEFDDFGPNEGTPRLKIRDEKTGLERKLGTVTGVRGTQLSPDGSILALHVKYDELDPFLTFIDRRWPWLGRHVSGPRSQPIREIRLIDSCKGDIFARIEVSSLYFSTDVQLLFDPTGSKLALDGAVLPLLRTDPMLVAPQPQRRVEMYLMPLQRRRPGRAGIIAGGSFAAILVGSAFDGWRQGRRRVGRLNLGERDSHRTR